MRDPKNSSASIPPFAQINPKKSLPATIAVICLAHSPLCAAQEPSNSFANVNSQNEAEYTQTQPSTQLAQGYLPSTRIDIKQSTPESAPKWTPTEKSTRSVLGAGSFDFSVRAQSYSGRFDWSIASDITGTRTPTVLSELTYEAPDISVLTYDYVKRFPISSSLSGSLEISYSKGGVTDGIAYDADYLGDNKTDTKSLSQADTTGSDITAQHITLGISRFLTGKTQISLLGGYARNSQAFVKRQGVQLYAARNTGVPAAGSTFNSLNSTYDASWKSGFLGTKLTHTTGAHRLTLRAEMHGAKYYAEANWNLRAAFQHPKSFEHIANGTGLNTSLAYEYALDKNLLLTLSAQREQWQTQDGLDRVFLASGQTVTTRLIETNWESTGYGIGITYVGGL